MQRILRQAIFLSFIFLPSLSLAQSEPMDIHGLHAGMITREIILYSHAPLDTIQWGGARGPSLIGFPGRYAEDTGHIRVNVVGTNIMRVTFNSIQRPVEENGAAFHRTLKKLTTLYGAPNEDYHNVYRIITWDRGNEELKLTTTDGGKFYSVALADSHAK